MNILFVCRGNVTRSLMAEYLARHILPNSDHVKSAGVRPDVPWGFTFDALETRGINARNHRPQPLSQELVDWADVIVGMDQMHLDAVTEYGKKAYLFNELATGEKTPLHDDETTPENVDSMHALRAFLFQLCDYMENAMPKVVQRARELCS